LPSVCAVAELSGKVTAAATAALNSQAEEPSASGSRAFPLFPTWSHFPRTRRSPIFRLAQNPRQKQLWLSYSDFVSKQAGFFF
jgi:hypothetical protein